MSAQQRIQNAIQLLKGKEDEYKYLDLARDNITGATLEDGDMRLLVLTISSINNYIPFDEMNLKNNTIQCTGLTTLLIGLRQSVITKLNLSGNHIGDEGVQCLSENIKNTSIINLNLRNTGISGKHLGDLLKRSNIQILNLNRNPIMDEGADIISKAIPDTDIRILMMGATNIGIKGAKALNEALKTSRIMYFQLEINITTSDNSYTFLYQESHGILHDIKLMIYDIGLEGLQYINETYVSTGINFLRLYVDEELNEEVATNLGLAFKGIKISHLELKHKLLVRPRYFEYLISIFRQSNIFALFLKRQQIHTLGVVYLVEFLKCVKIVSLNLYYNSIGDKGLTYLVPVLKNSFIKYINLEGNNIGPTGAQWLSKALKNTKLLQINLSFNIIGDEGARHLAEGLQGSQVTDLTLNHCMIGSKGYQLLREVVDKISPLEGDKITHLIVSMNSERISYTNLFNNIVKQDTVSQDFVFSTLTKEPDDIINQSPVLIKTLINNPNSKLHIIDEVCRIQDCFEGDFHLEKMSKIYEFIPKIIEKFNLFIQSNLTYLRERLAGFGLICLINNFFKMEDDVPGAGDVVRHLLQYKEQMYIDDDLRILDPYVYIILHKYNMPLYDELLEPNKKEEIMKFFDLHWEYDGAEEILQLLK